MSHQHEQKLKLSILRWSIGGVGDGAALPQRVGRLWPGVSHAVRAAMTHRPLFLFPGKGVNVSVTTARRALSRTLLWAAALFWFQQNPGVGTDTHTFA